MIAQNLYPAHNQIYLLHKIGKNDIRRNDLPRFYDFILQITLLRNIKSFCLVISILIQAVPKFTIVRSTYLFFTGYPYL